MKGHSRKISCCSISDKDNINKGLHESTNTDMYIHSYLSIINASHHNAPLETAF